MELNSIKRLKGAARNTRQRIVEVSHIECREYLRNGVWDIRKITFMALCTTGITVDQYGWQPEMSDSFWYKISISNLKKICPMMAQTDMHDLRIKTFFFI
jgi:hypothetical protein